MSKRSPCTSTDVLDAGVTGRDEPGRAEGIVRVDQPHLARRSALGVDDDEATVAGVVDADVEVAVVLLEHEHVVCRVGAELVPPDLVRPPRVVRPCVKEVAVVG